MLKNQINFVCFFIHISFVCLHLFIIKKKEKKKEVKVQIDLKFLGIKSEKKDPRGTVRPLFQVFDELGERVHEPVRVELDLVADDVAAEADEAVGGRTRLEVGGAVADHDHRAVAVRALQVLDDAALAARLARHLLLAEALVGARAVEPERVGVDARALYAQPVRHRVDDRTEAARDQVDGHVAGVQELDELVHARRQVVVVVGALGGVKVLDDLPRRTNDGEARVQGLAERHVSAHGLLGPRIIFKKIYIFFMAFYR
jgi:hypothetical protein